MLNDVWKIGNDKWLQLTWACTQTRDQGMIYHPVALGTPLEWFEGFRSNHQYSEEGSWTNQFGKIQLKFVVIEQELDGFFFKN